MERPPYRWADPDLPTACSWLLDGVWEAFKRGQAELQPEHVLLAILGGRRAAMNRTHGVESPAVTLLRTVGVDPSALQARLERRMVQPFRNDLWDDMLLWESEWQRVQEPFQEQLRQAARSLSSDAINGITADMEAARQQVTVKPPSFNTSERTDRMLYAAAEEAEALGEARPRGEHFILGMLQEGVGVAYEVLVCSGVTLEAARHALRR